jgi:hypothetical protein
VMTLIYSNVDSDYENNNENDGNDDDKVCDKVEFGLELIITGRRWKDDCERTENLSTTT